MSPFTYALQLLTRLPTGTGEQSLSEDEYKLVAAQALYYLAAVGLVVGGLLLLLCGVLSWAGLPPVVVAALILAGWIAVTGALHLDGLADSADAWLGGFGDKEKTLAIMKDPNCGPAGVVALVVILLVKFAALYSLLISGDILWLLFAPVIARAMAMQLFAETPYVRAGGMGELFANPKHHRVILLQLGIIGFLGFICFGWGALWAAVWVFIAWYVARALMIHRLEGTTGDTAGALIEFLECVVLIVAVA